MKKLNPILGTCLCGAAAGAINGLFGAGGGMILVPLLAKISNIEEDDIFPTSVSIILPICFVSLAIGANPSGLPFGEALPFLLGAVPGGLLAGILDRKIPVIWLHRLLGILILYGGARYIW